MPRLLEPALGIGGIGERVRSVDHGPEPTRKKEARSAKQLAPDLTLHGHSIGRWEGDALVIDVTDQTDQTWFDRAGNFHSEALRVVERYTLVDRNTINYEATMEDPKVFSRPWKISMPLYRHLEKNAQVMEYKCVEFVEELMYGHLRKQPSTP